MNLPAFCFSLGQVREIWGEGEREEERETPLSVKWTSQTAWAALKHATPKRDQAKTAIEIMYTNEQLS